MTYHPNDLLQAVDGTTPFSDLAAHTRRNHGKERS